MRYITPENIIKKRFENQIIPYFYGAVVIFSSYAKTQLIKTELKAEQADQKIIYGIEPLFTSIVTIGDKKILVLENCIWGGPQAAIIVEELAYFKVNYIIGIGSSGSISEKFDKGDFYYITKSIVTDGTSKFYTDSDQITIDNDLNQLLTFNYKEIKPGICGTIDAIYQETDELIEDFKKKSIELINMESAPFFAASEKYNMKSILFGYVSDKLLKKNWNDWYNTYEAAQKTGVMARKLIEIL